MITLMKNGFKIDHQFFLDKLWLVLEELKIHGDIVIKFGDEDESQKLNSSFRKKNKPTDVLSFPFRENLPHGFHLGDIFICHPMAERQAREDEIPLQLELFRLMIHGILHLSGEDHEKDSGHMFKIQEQLINKYYQP